jgi:hypothetical protein
MARRAAADLSMLSRRFVRHQARRRPAIASASTTAPRRGDYSGIDLRHQGTCTPPVRRWDDNPVTGRTGCPSHGDPAVSLRRYRCLKVEPEIKPG